MLCDNAYFREGDTAVMSLGRYPLQPEWWSRRYEYPWAIQYAKPNHVVADMGCGWMPRPFKERLAEVCKKVYAIDADARLLEQPNVRDNLIFVVRDFVNESLADLPRFDTIFCISVLEDLGVYLQDALMNFANLLKPGGQIVITFDVQLNESKPCPRYPGLLLTDMERAARAAGLMWSGSLDYSKEDCIKHVDFNLTVFHGVLKCRTK